MNNEEFDKEANEEVRDQTIQDDNGVAPEPENAAVIAQAYRPIPQKPRRITKGKLALIVVSIVFVSLLFWTALIFGVVYGLHWANNAETYTIGGESIPSIMSVVGERKFQSFDSSTNPINGSAYKKYTYRSVKNANEDLRQYGTYLLKEEGFLLTENCDSTKPAGAFQLAKQSELDEDKMILVDVVYSLGTYTITVQKGLGQVTPKN